MHFYQNKQTGLWRRATIKVLNIFCSHEFTYINFPEHKLLEIFLFSH